MSQRATARRPQRGIDAQRDQWVMLGAVAALAVAAVVVLVGLFFTVLRPPRAHVETIGEERLDAQTVERRVRYLLLNESTKIPQDVSQLTPTTLDVMEREAILRQRAPAVVGTVVPDDITKSLQTTLVPSLPAVTGVTSSGQPVTASTPTATATVDQSAYATALQKRLNESGLSKAQLDELVTATVLEQRLKDKFKGELPKAAAQVNLAVVRVTDQAKADQIRSIVLRPGVDFVQVADVNSVAGANNAPSGDLDWQLPEQLDQPVQDAIKGLKAGDVTPVIKNGAFLEIYKLLETSDSRDLTDGQRDALGQKRLDAWVAAERKNLTIERDLSTGEDDWIRTHAIRDYSKAIAKKNSG